MATLHLVPGQGAQIPGMGRVAAESNIKAAQLFDQASECIGRDLRDLCWNSTLEELTRTENLQPALTVAALASWLADDTYDRMVSGHRFAGHSIGALGAAAMAGSLDPVDAVALAAVRGQLMAEATPGGTMAALVTAKLDAQSQEELATSLAEDFDVDVAAYNGPTQIVFAGAVRNIEEMGQANRGKMKRLNVSNAFHSRFMESVIEPWCKVLDSADIRDAVGYVGSCLGTRAETAAEIRRDLARSFVNPVRWRQVLEETLDCTSVSIYGPPRVLARLLRPYKGDRPINSYELVRV